MVMKKLLQKKEYLFGVILIGLILFISYLSMSSIRLLQGNARVVNYVGIVRGATQKLIKEELMGWYLTQQDPGFSGKSEWYPDDKLLARLDGIINELLTGVGTENLTVLPDKTYLANMNQVKEHWNILKGHIFLVREGADPIEMFDSSQDYFNLVNETVFSAEAYSENRVNRINTLFIAINSIFIVLILVILLSYIRSITIKKRADALGKIAYVDTLTSLANRASCERQIAHLQNIAPETSIAALMFDMNNLKLTNDFLGHQGGDKLIISFADILKKSAGETNFVCRYGGDEFLAIFENSNESQVEAYLTSVDTQVTEYNSMRTNKLERISFAVGYVVGPVLTGKVEAMIDEADRRMYVNKRIVKGVL